MGKNYTNHKNKHRQNWLIPKSTGLRKLFSCVNLSYAASIYRGKTITTKLICNRCLSTQSIVLKKLLRANVVLLTLIADATRCGAVTVVPLATPLGCNLCSSFFFFGHDSLFQPSLFCTVILPLFNALINNQSKVYF